jgi:exopolysaccharide biosynthesis WecB/TagA/CpsF family protein
MDKSENFGQLRFDHFSKDDLVNNILEYTGSLQRVVTPNVDHVVRANSNPELIPLSREAEISVNDSRVLNKIARIARKDLGEVIPGSDLTMELFKKLSGSDTRITVIGCSEESLEIVKEKFHIPNVAHYNPPMGFINDEKEVSKCVNLIVENSPTIVFLAVGSPRQEILARKAKEAGATGSALCIGASLLFLAGEEKRAPKIFQQLSLEWLFRLIQSPKRLAKRYLVDGMKIFPILLHEMLFFR